MPFKEVIPFELAVQEVNDYLDRKGTLPRRKEKLAEVIESVAEGIQLGNLVIGDGDVITHTLFVPVKDAAGNEVVLSDLTYKSRLDPATVNKKLSELKVLNSATQSATISSMLTGQPAGILAKLEPQDKNICDCISLFFI